MSTTPPTSTTAITDAQTIAALRAQVATLQSQIDAANAQGEALAKQSEAFTQAKSAQAASPTSGPFTVTGFFLPQLLFAGTAQPISTGAGGKV